MVDIQRMMAHLEQTKSVYENTKDDVIAFVWDDTNIFADRLRVYDYALKKLKMDIHIPSDMQLQVYGNVREWNYKRS